MITILDITYQESDGNAIYLKCHTMIVFHNFYFLYFHLIASVFMNRKVIVTVNESKTNFNYNVGV